jgi:hypothetical protein
VTDEQLRDAVRVRIVEDGPRSDPVPRA